MGLKWRQEREYHITRLPDGSSVYVYPSSNSENWVANPIDTPHWLNSMGEWAGHPEEMSREEAFKAVELYYARLFPLMALADLGDEP